MRVAVDAAVFTIQNEILKILLIKRRFPPFKNHFALPGGFLRPEEEPWEAALRELEEETGVKDIYMA
jgi:8-oxo-dGTP diphosphatase